LFLDLSQQPRGVLDLVVDDFTVWRCLFSPGVVEIGGLARGPMLLREDLRHALTLLGIDARRRRQIAHGNLRGDVAVAHPLLDRFRERVHQRQTARHPRRAAVETPRELLDGVAEFGFHLRQ
jgi:hypothetical protein